jgi:hypothetical protein
VRTFGELLGAINGDGDNKLIKLYGTIIFTKEIELTSTNSGGDRQLTSTPGATTFICPNGDCVFDGESNNRFFHIPQTNAGKFVFNDITIKNGNAIVSPQ